MDNVNVTVAENLKRIRISKGWSQSFVASQLGIAQRTISRAECGCGVSKRTLKILCGLYQVSISSLYNEDTKEIPKDTQIVPEDVAVGLLLRNSFIQDLEKEVILRYRDVILKEALMLREDAEKIISEAVASKKVYTLSDMITAGMLINQKTLSEIRKLTVV